MYSSAPSLPIGGKDAESGSADNGILEPTKEIWVGVPRNAGQWNKGG
jgi:hypothetical protein